MNKKRILLLSSVALTVLVLAGLAGVTIVSAQEPTPTPTAPFKWGGRGPGWGGFGRGGFGWAGGGQWTMFDTAAEALGLSPEELFAELHAGKTLDEIAEAQGVDVQTVYDAMNANRVEAQKQAIQQAVEDGNMTQEQADWMLEGLERGFFPGGRGFGFHRGRCIYPESE
jgi:uncharacterized membrane protein